MMSEHRVTVTPRERYDTLARQGNGGVRGEKRDFHGASLFAPGQKRWGYRYPKYWS
jgi:hypothetical protein